MFWLRHFITKSHLTTRIMEGKLKILDRNLKILHAFIPYFVHLGTFTMITLTGNVHVLLGCTKTQSPGNLYGFALASSRCTHFL